MNKKPLHILMIPSWYDTTDTPQVGLIFEEQALMLKRGGYQVGVLYPNFIGGFKYRSLRFKRNKYYNYLQETIPVFVSLCYSIVPQSRNINYYYIYRKSLKQFKKYVEAYGWPDIIHAHELLSGGVVAFYLSGKFNIPYVFTDHSDPEINYINRTADKKFFRRISRTAKATLFVSKYLREKQKEYFGNNVSNIHIIPNSISPIFFNNNYIPMGKAKFTFILIGALVDVKDHKLAIHAFSLLKSYHQNVQLKIIGDGPLRSELEAYVINKKIDNIYLLGHLSRDLVKKQVDECHALLSTSKVETFGICIAEALASGKPVVATDSGGPGDIIEEGDGYLVKDHTPEAVSQAMNDIIQNYNSFLPEQISHKCRQKFSEEAIVKQLEKIYRRKYEECSRCILSTDDYPEIIFDEKGVCNICHTYDKIARETIIPDQEKDTKLKDLLEAIRLQAKGKDYNCLLGVSGGVDSTYLAYLTKQWKLKPLVVHIDNGWNSELAVENIKNILNKLEYDLHTHVIDWEAMKDMHYSFLKASVLDTELPFDNTFVALLYKIAAEQKLKYILCGYNTTTEGWLPPNFTHFKYDSLNLRDIHRKFGRNKKVNFEIIGPLDILYYQKIKGIKLVSPLNMVHYSKDDAKQILVSELGWRDYGYKHYENVFTRFYQGYILPQKFGVDKRKAHLSTLICSGQISREEAIIEAGKHIYGDNELLNTDLEYVIKKLDIDPAEFNEIMSAPIKYHTDYRSVMNIYKRLIAIKQSYRRIRNAIFNQPQKA